MARPMLVCAPRLMRMNPKMVEDRTTVMINNVNIHGRSPACKAVYEGTESTVNAQPAKRSMKISRADAPNVPSKYSEGKPIGRRIHTIAAPEANPIGTSAKQIDSTLHKQYTMEKFNSTQMLVEHRWLVSCFSKNRKEGGTHCLWDKESC